MMRPLSHLTALALAVLAAGCTSLAPATPPTPLADLVPGALPAAPGTPISAQPAWDALLQDERLRATVAHALAHNRDLRMAVLNVQRSRAEARIAGADRWPTVGAQLVASRAPNAQDQQSTTLQAGLAVASWEVDLFGRVASQNDAAAQAVLASEAAQRAARLAVITQTAAAWLTLVAHEEQVALARANRDSRSETLRLVRLHSQAGTASDTELRGAEALAAQADAALAQLERERAAARHALTALVGDTLPPALWPEAGTHLAQSEWLAAVPAALSSDALLARPDVMQAEALLHAAGARVGMARAALWPRLALTGNAGSVSSTLAGLFDSGTFAWTLGAQAAVALFDAGRNRAAVQVAEADRDIAIARYEQTVQRAFQSAADALTAQAAWDEQARATSVLAQAESERQRLMALRLNAGTVSLLDTLDAERALATAQQADVQVRLATLLNRLALYAALGGDQPTTRDVSGDQPDAATGSGGI